MKKSKKTYQKLLIFLILHALLLSSLISCQNTSAVDGEIDVYEDEDVGDEGEKVIDSFVFLGESTTSHLKNRGVLSGGVNTDRVLSTSSGTLCLDASIASVKLRVGDEDMTVSEAVKAMRPRRIMLCFGLNGAKRNASGDGRYFKACYKRLVSLIRDASPSTEIYIQSCYPIAANMDTSAYGCSPSELNSVIDLINSYARDLARELGLTFVDTSPLLKDGRGMLAEEYQAGDGYHLTASAYKKVLGYIEKLGSEGGL